MVEPAQADTCDPAWVTTCWCCGGEDADGAMVHLGAHPEVALCGDCARWVHRRSRRLRDSGRRGAGVLARAVVRAGRDRVLRHDLQHVPVLGVLLRRLDRHLP